MTTGALNRTRSRLSSSLKLQVRKTSTVYKIVDETCCSEFVTFGWLKPRIEPMHTAVCSECCAAVGGCGLLHLPTLRRATSRTQLTHSLSLFFSVDWGKQLWQNAHTELELLVINHTESESCCLWVWVWLGWEDLAHRSCGKRRRDVDGSKQTASREMSNWAALSRKIGAAPSALPVPAKKAKSA